MSETLKEALSAAVDNEADEFELRRVIDEAGKDPALRDTWERYHVVSAVLADRATDASIASREALKNRIWQELDYANEDDEAGYEALPEPAGRTGFSPWIGRAVGFAVALGVAALVVVGSDGLFEAPGGGQVADLDVPPAAAEPTAEDRVRSDAYLMHHVQHTALNRSGVMSFVKVVTYDKADSDQ